MSEATVAFDKVSLVYRGGPVWNRREVSAVRNVSLTIGQGEVLGLVGESGSGKSSLGRLALGLASPSSGTVLLEGRAVEGRRSLRGRASVVLQQPEWALNPRLTIATSVGEPLAVLGVSHGERAERVSSALLQVGLDPGMLRRYPHELSGGQRQRASIARALVTDARFIVFDEAVSALDVSVQVQILNLIKSIRSARDFSAIFISHDLAATRYVSDRIAVMRDGEIVEVGATDRFYEQPLHPYSRELWQAARL